MSRDQMNHLHIDQTKLNIARFKEVSSGDAGAEWLHQCAVARCFEVFYQAIKYYSTQACHSTQTDSTLQNECQNPPISTKSYF